MTGAVYLDHAATSFPKAPGVAEAVADALRTAAGNPGRGGHRLAVAAARLVEAARDLAADLLGSDPERTLLGPGATHWINTVLASRLRPGDRVVTSALEHNAVMRPLRHLQQRLGLEVVVLAGEAASGVPTPAEAAAAVAAAPTSLVVLTHASNVTGAVLPVEAIATAVSPVPLLVDAAQTAGSMPLDFAHLGVAALACSAHKGLLGPHGLGLLLLAPHFPVEPLLLGGTGSRSDSEEMPDGLPDRLEAGTANVPAAAGLVAACRWLSERGTSEVHRHATNLTDQLHDALARLPGVLVHGRNGRGERVGILSFTVDGVDPGELAAWLDRDRGIMVRAGLHCAPAAHRRLGTFPSGTLRVGIGPFTTAEEVDLLADAVAEATSRRPRRGGAP